MKALWKWLRARAAARKAEYYDAREWNRAALRKERQAGLTAIDIIWRPWR